MAFRHFSLMLGLRLGALFACLLALAWLIAATDFVAAPVLVAGLSVLLGAELLGYVHRTNLELGRFLDAIRHADFSQSFTAPHDGAGFAELGRTLAAAMERFRASRAGQEREVRYLRAVIEQVPVPLLSLASGGRIHLLNNAARRFFALHAVTRLEDLSGFGPELASALRELAPGERRLVRLLREEGRTEQIAVSLAEIVAEGERQRLVAMQNISGELEATELEAWQRLVGVLTHEIMNSLTPVASLSATAAGLLGTASPDPASLGDAREAVETVARRAEMLMRFVESYRQLTRLPRPKPARIPLARLFARLERLTAADRAAGGIVLETDITPAELELVADPGQIEQVLINLLRNAIEALEGRTGGRIRLIARLDRRGRTVVEVADNGPGVAGEAAEQIFVPFFTTKRGGSGVGLALTRQVMIAHKGSVSAHKGQEGGAVFRLMF